MAAAALATVFLGALTTTASSAGLCAEGILLQPGLDLTLTKYKYLSRGWLDATFRKDSATLCVGSTSKERTENRYQWIGGFAQEGYGTRKAVDRYIGTRIDPTGPTAPKPKTWWAKRLAPTEPRLYFGGPPNERDMKMLYEQGFDAVYSVLPASSSAAFGGTDLEGNMKLTAAQAKTKAAEIGLFYDVTIAADFTSQAALSEYERFLDFALANTDGPVYVYCGFGNASSTALQMYRLDKGTLPKTAAGIDQAIAEVGYHGIDISTHKAGLEVASGATARYGYLPTIQAGELINDYHWAKYLGKLGNTQFYIAGQFHQRHVNAFKSKVATVVNMRRSPSDGGIETTNLLNVNNSLNVTIRWGTRHSSSFIKANPQYVVDNTRTDGWAGPANQNFESFNTYEYGNGYDNGNGYASTLEKQQMGFIADMKYAHLPIGGKWKWTKEALVHYAPEMIAAINHARAKGKHVLFHDDTGYRAGAFATLLLGVLQGTSSADMTSHLKAVGYDFDVDKPPLGQTGTSIGRVGLLFNTVNQLKFDGWIPASATAPITGTVLPPSPPLTVGVNVPGDVAALTFNTTVKTAFEAAFATDIATALGINASRITSTCGVAARHGIDFSWSVGLRVNFTIELAADGTQHSISAVTTALSSPIAFNSISSSAVIPSSIKTLYASTVTATVIKGKCLSLSSCGSGKVRDLCKDNEDCAGTICTATARINDTGTCCKTLSQADLRALSGLQDGSAQYSLQSGSGSGSWSGSGSGGARALPCNGNQGCKSLSSIGVSTSFNLTSYTANNDCYWTLSCSNNLQPHLTFTAFNTENGSDYVYLWCELESWGCTDDMNDQTQMKCCAPNNHTYKRIGSPLSGNSTNSTATATYPSMRIRFTSDGQTQGTGFNAIMTCVSGAPSSFTSSATSPPANSVAATIKLSTDISTIQAGTAARTAFEVNFVTDMAKLLGNINKERIKITSIKAGSIIVAFYVLPDSAGTALSVTTLTSAFKAAGVSVAGSKTVSVIIITTSPPTTVATTAVSATASTTDEGSGGGRIVIVIIIVVAIGFIGAGGAFFYMRSRNGATAVTVTTLVQEGAVPVPGAQVSEVKLTPAMQPADPH